MADVNKDNRGKKRASASNAILYTLFTIGAVVMINLISTRVFGRLDLTEHKTYTLSPSSKDLVKKLPDFLTVKAFISPDLPPEVSSMGRYVRDLVDEYKAASNGKLRWEAISVGEEDKEKAKKIEDEAARCKVQKVQIQKIKGQKFELGAYYLGLCFEYGTQMESIPQVARAEGLEYQISSLIKRMTQRKRKVAFTTGHGESDTNQGFAALKEALEREYDITTINPSSAEIGKDVDALVIGGPKQPFDEKGLKEIDKFLMTGKGAILLVDGMALSSPGGGHGMEQLSIKMAQENKTGLEKLLEPYGFKVEVNFVLDRQAAPGLWDMGGGRKALLNLPAFVTAEIEKAPDLSMLQGLRGMVFPYGSSVALTGPLAGGKVPAGAKLWKLATSSQESWKQTNFLVLGGDPRQINWDPPKDAGSMVFGYAFQGTLRSAFAPAAAPANESTAEKPQGESAKPVRLVVMGDSDFANDEYVQLARMFQIYQAGAELLYSAIGWTVEDEALTPLRAKTVSPRPIKLSSEAAGTALQIGNMLGVPTAFCLFGVVLWRVRRARRTGAKL